MLRPLRRASLAFLALSFFWCVTNRRIDGTSQVLGLRGVSTEDKLIDFFCPGSFVGNTVLVLTAQNAALFYEHD
jgi:hypothetical protein